MSETVYEIRDADGRLVALHVRTDHPDGSKSVAWKQPDGTWGLNGTKLAVMPLYGSELVADLGEDELIAVTEGEKARDALEAVGLPAVGTVTGAGVCPGSEALEVLRDRRVVLWADNDEQGRKHMQRVGRELEGVAAEVLTFTWDEAPEKGDAADHPVILSGDEKAVDRLLTDLEGSPRFEPARDGVAHSTRFEPADLREAILNGLKRPEMVIREMMYEGRVHGLYAAGGMGKTWMALWIIKQAIEQRKKVLLLDLENGTRIIADRLRSLGVDPELVQKYLRYCPFPSLPLSVDASADFEALLDEFQPHLIVVDSWINCLAAAGLDENSSTDIARWTEAYTQRARARRIAVLILDHEPKEGGSARGSGRKLDYVDVMWELKNPVKFNREATGRVDLRLKKDREGWLPRGLTFTVGPGEDGTLEFSRSLVAPLSANETTELLKSDRTVLEALREIGNGGAFDKDWCEKATSKGLGRTTYYRSRGTLIELGYAEKVMNKYFPKTPAKPVYQEVPSESHGTNGTSAFGEKSHESHHPRGWDSWDYQADTPEDQEPYWLDDEED